MGLMLRIPESIKTELDRRADRERRSTNSEAVALIEWALRNMPEQLQATP